MTQEEIDQWHRNATEPFLSEKEMKDICEAEREHRLGSE